jgi:protocatechuate 3,4-dioxygenase beta subunit
VLNDSRVIRRDIRSDLDGTDTQSGTPMTLTMTVQNVNGSCAVLAGYYVYVWHCSARGNYSQYSGSMNGGDFSANSFFRGVQVTDSNGQVTFTTIFPGRYSGRATHIHFEVYAPSANVGTSNFAARSQVATSQLAFPASATDGSESPYTNATLYPNSATNNTQNSNDNVFSDGTTTEMLTITGNNTDGYVATITLAVSG